jgi:small subunit ribosomal protein S20
MALWVQPLALQAETTTGSQILAHHKSAKKRIRQNEKKRIRNRHIRTTLRSALKKFEQTLAQQNSEELKALIDKTISIVDKAASKGVIHKNKAARHVSQIRRKASSLLASSPNA